MALMTKSPFSPSTGEAQVDDSPMCCHGSVVQVFLGSHDTDEEELAGPGPGAGAGAGAVGGR